VAVALEVAYWWWGGAAQKGKTSSRPLMRSLRMIRKRKEGKVERGKGLRK
jgi:hypothetical protein